MLHAPLLLLWFAQERGFYCSEAGEAQRKTLGLKGCLIDWVYSQLSQRRHPCKADTSDC